ncbi:EAL domain-containing protein [uncultured Aquitalea sp.]|uniref:EAL domain-containing protein n=1 Tax=uncultured Aquitalea sp. TaxID=540272 RepID=UPI0025EE5F9A|nr:EAL domain-containing protein [uncultured Aquitalea sp.]
MKHEQGSAHGGGVWRRIAAMAAGWACALLCAFPALAAPASIRVVMDDNYPPYIFRDADGQPEGILRDVWALWEKKTGIKVEFIATDWGKAQAMMKSGQADVIDTLFETEERKRFYAFSPPHANIDVPIFFHQSISGITDANSLKGFTVGVKDGDACIEYLVRHGIHEFKRYPGYQELVRAAAAQNVRVLCIDAPPAFYFFNKEGAADQFRHTDPLYSGQFHWAVAKGRDALYRDVLSGFDKISLDERAAIERHWLGENLPTGRLPSWARWAGYTILALGLLLAGLAVWSKSLTRKVRLRTAELSHALASLRKSEAYNKALFSKSQIPMVVMETPSMVFIDCNEAARRIYGLPSCEAMLGLTPLAVSPERQPDGRASREAAAEFVEQALREGHVVFEWRHQRPDGSQWEARVQLMSLEHQGRHMLHFNLEDITDSKRSAQEIRKLAFYDTLTGLPNRQLMMDRLSQAMRQTREQGGCGALLLIDLDNFKVLNDSEGHAAGDKLLVAVAGRLRSTVRDSDVVARLGGDEFVIILSGLEEDAAAAAGQRAERILERLSTPFALASDWGGRDGGARPFVCTASMGIALFNASDSSEEELLQRADTAMYRAKHSGRNAWFLFDPEMQAAVQARVTLEGELRFALADRQFFLVYQPQYNNEGVMVGAEALLRWRHPERGVVGPLTFIPVAEDTGMILPIGQWVLEEACRQLAAWAHDPRRADITLAVNVSARQFMQPGFETGLRAILTASGARPDRLKLELTETMMLEDTETIIARMHAIKACGVSFAMDDFGTGFSSLSYLKRLPISQLKIDRSFVRDILDDPNDAAIARTIIALGQTLGMTVLAEGVETRAQQDFLLQAGCFLYQGYLFGKPVPAAEFDNLLG